MNNIFSKTKIKIVWGVCGALQYDLAECCELNVVSDS